MSIKAEKMPYVVTVGDSFGFDFGGVIIAKFAHQGNAFIAAKQMISEYTKEAHVLKVKGTGYQRLYVLTKESIKDTP